MHFSKNDWASFTQFVHELIGSTVRRHTFSQWELDLLVDLQMSSVRKSSRPDLLRRYLKAVHHSLAQAASAPPRLSNFLKAEQQARVNAANARMAAAAN